MHFGHLMKREDSLEKTPMFRKSEGKRRRRRQRTRWMDSVIKVTNINLIKLQEAVEDRRAWRALVHGVTKNRTTTKQQLSTVISLTRRILPLWNFFFST